MNAVWQLGCRCQRRLPGFAGRRRPHESHLHRIVYAVGLFQNITNATLIVPLTDSTMSCLQINFA